MEQGAGTEEGSDGALGPMVRQVRIHVLVLPLPSYVALAVP